MAQFTFTLQELESLIGHDELKKWFKAYNLRDYLTAEQVAVIRQHDTWTEDKLAEDIIKHYYIRESGLETPALFKLKLEALLTDIMESKAPLLYTMCMKYEPLNGYESHDTSKSHVVGSTDSNGNGLVINSTTPQGQINKNEILAGTYASSTTGNEEENHIENGQDTDTTHDSYGRNSSAMSLIREFRSNIVTLNKDIISDLSELFIGIYG